eukprot:2333933-Amphidinium_carterae.3
MEVQWQGNEYETTHNTSINEDIKIASVVNTVRGQLRTHLLLNMTDDDIKNTMADFFQSTYVIQQTHSGGHGHQGHQPMEIDQINGFKGKKGKKSQTTLHTKGKARARKAKANNIRSSSGVTVTISRKAIYQQGQYHTQYQQFPGNGENQSKGSSSQNKGKGNGKSSCWWKGPVYQLDATDSDQPPMPLESGTMMMDQSATRSGQVSGLWSPGPIITEIMGAIMDIHNRVKEDS